MEDNFYNDDEFEDFLQSAVRNHRMYPSDGIWRKIHNRLHGDTNWPALTIAAFTFLAIIITFSFYFSPSPDFFSVTEYNKALLQAKVQKSASHANGSNLLNKQRPNDKTQVIPFVENGSPGNDAAGVVDAAEVSSNTETVPSVGVNVDNQRPMLVDIKRPSRLAENAIYPSTLPDVHNDEGKLQAEAKVKLPLSSAISPDIEIAPAGSNTTLKDDAGSGFTIDNGQMPGGLILETNPTANVPPASIEHHISKLKRVPKNKYSYLVYITPSRSYRRLTQSPSQTGKSGGPLALNYFVDVNKVARYNPGAGVEAGVSFMYNITDKLKVATGLQFNVRQYSLEAYIAPADISTIALNNPRSGTPDTINTYAIYRTSNGYLSTELVNRYYEISLPVGLVWEVLGNRNIRLYVAASVQPTYLINRNAYLISTDFKNYTVNPGLMKSWNINTNLEAYISIKSGDFNWQIGPQFRYQNLPSSISRYPIRENLIDYGLKIGVTKDLK